jgi:arginine deiminase
MGADSEIGRLRTVLVHRPGPEIGRITPRHRERLLFGTLPWLSRARQEHDLLCQALRDHGVEVLYLTELLQDVLEYQVARDNAISLAVADADLGEDLRGQLRAHLDDLAPEELAKVLIAGVTPQELRIGGGVVYALLDRHDFVLDPLPNLIFTKDSSFWVGDRVAVASLPQARGREPGLASLIYTHHPRFAGTTAIYGSGLERLDGGDVLLLAPGVIAIGVGPRTTPAAAERLARRLFDAGLAESVLAVPLGGVGTAGHLDTICTLIGPETVVMHPAVAYGLTAHTITARAGGMRVSRRQPFLEAAALAMGIERLRVLDTGTDPVGGHDQWGGCGNVLTLGPGLVVSHERDWSINARLEDAGIRVIPVPSSELGSMRGGPRCMACAVGRDSAAAARQPRREPAPVQRLFRDTLVLAGAEESTSPIGRLPQLDPVPAVAHSSGRVPGQPRRTGLTAGAPSRSVPVGLAPSAGTSADTEDPDDEREHKQDHAEHEEPHQEVDHHGGNPEHDDRRGDQHQQAKHASTLHALGPWSRPPGQRCMVRIVSSGPRGRGVCSASCWKRSIGTARTGI